MESTQPQLPGSLPDEMFPVLAAEHQARVLEKGRIRKVISGETLVEFNQRPTKVFVVVEGKLEVFRVTDDNEEVVAGISQLKTWNARIGRSVAVPIYSKPACPVSLLSEMSARAM